jgi:hypothetical protein
MRTGLILAFAAATLLSTKTAHASSLVVEQWQGGGAGNNFLAGALAAMASGPADIAVFASIIDYTDDPAGFAGNLPGSSPWPLAAANGATGTGHVLNNDFAVRISANLTVASAGLYGFRTFADDGVRLRIDGIDVIVDNSYHPEQERFGSLVLGAGSHALELIFFEGGGEASLEFSMNLNGGAYGHVGDFEGTSTAPIPEPATISLLGGGLATLAARFRRRKNG